MLCVWDVCLLRLLENVLHKLRRWLLLFFGAIYGGPGGVGRALPKDIHVAVVVVFWRLDGVVSALLRSRLSKPLYLALYGAGVSGGGFNHRRAQPYVTAAPSDTSAVLSRLSSRRHRRPCRRRAANTALSRHRAQTTKTRVYEDVYEYQQHTPQLRRPPPQPLLNN